MEKEIVEVIDKKNTSLMVRDIMSNPVVLEGAVGIVDEIVNSSVQVLIAALENETQQELARLETLSKSSSEYYSKFEKVCETYDKALEQIQNKILETQDSETRRDLCKYYEVVAKEKKETLEIKLKELGEATYKQLKEKRKKGGLLEKIASRFQHS